MALIGLAAAAFAGFALRSVDIAKTFVGSAVIFQEFDPYYHMRRVFMILSDYPNVPYFDAALNFPKGAPIIWPPMFDFFVASVSLILGYGAQDAVMVESVSAYISPVIGALTSIPVFLLARETLRDSRKALAAAFLVTLVPAHIWYSRIGFVDHHSAVTFIQTLMFFLFLRAGRAFGAGGEAEEPVNRKILWGTACAATLAAGFLTWNGFTIYAVILDIFLGALIMVEHRDGRYGTALTASGSHLAAAAMIIPFAAKTVAHGAAPFSAVTISYFHVAALGAFGAFAFLSHMGAVSGQSRNRKSNIAIRAMLAMFIVAALVPVAASMWTGLDWVFTADRFMASVRESRAMFAGGLAADLPEAIRWLTGFLVLFPAMYALMLYRWAGEGFKDANKLFILIWAGVMFMLAMKQTRFGEAFAPALAVMSAWFLFELHDFARTKIPTPRAMALSIPVALAIVMLCPYYAAYAQNPGRLLAVFTHDAKTAPAPSTDYDYRLHEAFTGFRKTLKITSGPGDSMKALPGVMLQWGIGHKVRYIMGLPPVSDNFGSHTGWDSYRDWAGFYFAENDGDAARILERRNVKYVVSDFAMGAIESAATLRGVPVRNYYSERVALSGSTLAMEPALIRTPYFRLSRLGGSHVNLKNRRGNSLDIPALSRFRLIADSPYDDRDETSLKLYEFVKGARLSVAGVKKGGSCSITYKFVSSAGRERIYTDTAMAGEDGRLSFLLPYSSERPEYGHTAGYVITCGQGFSANIHIREKDVVDGGLVEIRL